MFPIDGAGSILFGAWLVIMPEFFVNILMYLIKAFTYVFEHDLRRDFYAHGRKTAGKVIRGKRTA